MSKQNTRLLVLLVALAAGFALVKWYDSRKGERNFRSELVSIDSAKVSTFLIYPKEKKKQEVKLYLDNGQWKVKVSDTKSLTVGRDRMAGLFKSVKDIKPARLAGRTPDKWKEFEVDTTGTHVIVKEGDKKALDITIGKMAFLGGREVETYVRLEGDNETYAVNGYLQGTFNGGVDEWRDKTVIKSDQKAWKKLSFTLGDTMKYELVKQDSVWRIDGIMNTDKKKVSDYFNSIATTMGTGFVDDVDAATLSTPQGIVQIDDSTGASTKVEGYVHDNKKIIRSSLNSDNLIKGDGVWEKLFVPKTKFFAIDTVRNAG